MRQILSPLFCQTINPAQRSERICPRHACSAAPARDPALHVRPCPLWWGHGPARHQRRWPLWSQVSGGPLYGKRTWHPWHRSLNHSLISPIYSVLVRETMFLTHLLAFRAFQSPLVFILFHFLLSFECMPLVEFLASLRDACVRACGPDACTMLVLVCYHSWEEGGPKGGLRMQPLVSHTSYPTCFSWGCSGEALCFHTHPEEPVTPAGMATASPGPWVRAKTTL